MVKWLFIITSKWLIEEENEWKRAEEPEIDRERLLVLCLNDTTVIVMFMSVQDL